MSEPSDPPAGRAPTRAERSYVRGVFRFLFGLWLLGLGLTGVWFVVRVAGLAGLTGRAIGLADLMEPIHYAAILVLMGAAAWLARLGVKALFPHAFEPVRGRGG